MLKDKKPKTASSKPSSKKQVHFDDKSLETLHEIDPKPQLSPPKPAKKSKNAEKISKKLAESDPGTLLSQILINKH